MASRRSRACPTCASRTHGVREWGPRIRALARTRHIDVVLLDDGATIEAGAPVRARAKSSCTPVGPGLLGRVIDPLGRPLDRDEPVQAFEHAPSSAPRPASSIATTSASPSRPGILVIDALFALGRGQRELIIGDRATGKTRSRSTRSSIRNIPMSSASMSRSGSVRRRSSA